jgi:hypothetical protein
VCRIARRSVVVELILHFRHRMNGRDARRAELDEILGPVA